MPQFRLNIKPLLQLLAVMALLASFSLAFAGDAVSLNYLAGRLDDAQLAELQALAPNVNFLVGLSEEEILVRAPEIDAADAHLLNADFLAAANRLQWVQSWSAGVDRYLQLPGLRGNDQIVLTNMQGVHGPAIAEHVMASLLALTRKLPQLQAAQNEGRWDRNAAAGATTLSGRTIFVVGMGGIGSQIARRAHAFDMKVLATVRNPQEKEKPAYVAEMGGAEDLDRFLARADVVVVALPLTSETEGLFDAARFAKMPAGSWFLNIGRGPIVDTDALVAALQSGHLAGAALDVTDPEPLPEGHALWGLPNVIITPHVASRAELTGQRRWEIIKENVRRFAAGQELINVVDKEIGY